MKKVNLYITDEQEKWLIEQNIKLGLSGKSEVLRRVIDRVKDDQLNIMRRGK